MTNYEHSHKTPPEEDKDAEEKAKSEQDYDIRTKKHGKVIKKVSIKSEKSDVLHDPETKFWLASAKATAYARDLTNTRGSVATPDYME